MRYVKCSVDYITMEAPTLQECLNKVNKFFDKYPNDLCGLVPFVIEVKYPEDGMWLASFPGMYDEVRRVTESDYA